MKRAAIRRPDFPVIVLAAATCVVLLAVLTMWAARTYGTRLDALRHTVEVQRGLALILSSLQDAETGERGFLITGEERYLGPYVGARLRLPGQLKAFDALIADDPDQVRAARALRPVIDARLRVLENEIALRRAGRIPDAFTAVGAGEGKVLMDDLRLRIAQMDQIERRRLVERSALRNRINLTLFSLLLVSLIATVGGLILWLVQARRDARRLMAAHTEIEAANRRLEREASERTLMEDQIRQMQKMEAVGQLTGGIAHDFNNMLAVVIGNIELARRSAAQPEKLDAYLANAEEGSKRAAGLTRRLLAFSRQQPLEPKPLDLNRLVGGMSDLLLRSLGETIQVETILAGGLWRTFADAGEVENAILNLAVNARDAMPEGGRVTIETANAHLDDAYVSAHADVKAGQYVLICVSDTGVGMPPDIVAKAFDPFFTTKGVGKGTGLGLSQIYGFARQSGGHVRIYSEVGRGATVRMYLPRHYGPEAASAPHPTPARPADPAGSPDQVILVVEDEDRVRAVTVDALRALGYTVVHAEDGARALTLLDQMEAVALLLTDVVMPGMTGRELAEAASLRRPGLKVLYTTGYTRNAVVHNGVIDPGVAFLQKPFSIAQLSDKVAAVLAGPGGN